MFSTETLVKNIVNKVRGVHLVATDSEPVDTMTDMDAVVAPSRRQRQREATVEEVLTVASALVARDGAAALSLREIAQMLHVTESRVSQIRTRALHRQRLLDGALCVKKLPAIGEAVGSHVQHAHYESTVSEKQRSGS